MIYINVCTHLKRKDTLQNCINAIDSANFDQNVTLNVIANDYLPELTVKSKHITLNIIKPHLGDFGAKSKFWAYDSADGYWFFVDDDIMVKPNYFKHLILKIEQYGRKAVVGLHGTDYNTYPIKSYYKSGKVTYFNAPNNKDKFVSMLGTGVMAFHSDTLKGQNIFTRINYKNMVDVEVMRIFNKLNLPLVCVERKEVLALELERTQHCAIWKQVTKNDAKQTELVNEIPFVKHVLK